MVQPTPLSTAVPVGLDFRPRRLRTRRRAYVPLPVAVLALGTLGVCWCWDSRRRVPLAAASLLGVILAAQLALVLPRLTGLAWPPLALPALPALTLPSLSGILARPAPSSAVLPAAEPVSAPQPVSLAPDAASTANAVSTAPGVPEAAAAGAPGSAAARAPWQPPNAAIAPYPDYIEAWRPLVRELLSEAHAEGRLEGPAVRLDDDLVLALIRQESQGNPDAISWAGAIGLMQVMPFTFADMMHGDRSLTCAIDRAAMWDVRSNVRAGLRYLSLALTTHEGNLYWALAAYNAGIDAVRDWRAAGLYAVPPAGGYWETADYAQIILRDYLRRRPDIAPLIHLPDPMPQEHVPGALRLLRDLDAQRGGPRPAEFIPRCPR